MSATLVRRIIGIALVVIGVGLAYWGYEMSESIGARISHTFTGSYSDEVMLRFIGGAVSFFVGLFLVLKK